jgi:hypothetical protein
MSAATSLVGAASLSRTRDNRVAPTRFVTTASAGLGQLPAANSISIVPRSGGAVDGSGSGAIETAVNRLLKPPWPVSKVLAQNIVLSSNFDNTGLGVRLSATMRSSRQWSARVPALTGQNCLLICRSLSKLSHDAKQCGKAALTGGLRSKFNPLNNENGRAVTQPQIGARFCSESAKCVS